MSIAEFTGSGEPNTSFAFEVTEVQRVGPDIDDHPGGSFYGRLLSRNNCS
jgi:hypothetical protein